MFDIKFEADSSHPHYTDYVDIVVDTILNSGFPPEQVRLDYYLSVLQLSGDTCMLWMNASCKQMLKSSAFPAPDPLVVP